MRRGIDTDAIKSRQIDDVRGYPADSHNLVNLDDRITLSILALNLEKWDHVSKGAQIMAKSDACSSQRAKSTLHIRTPSHASPCSQIATAKPAL